MAIKSFHKKIIGTATRHKLLLLSFVFFLLFSAFIKVFAVFTPGQTLDPNCTPTTSGCTVTIGTGGNLYFAVSGPTTSTKTFTFPDASATVLTSNDIVTVPQGGTGAGTFTAHGVLLGNTTSAFGVTSAGTTGQVLTGVTGSDPSWTSTPTVYGLTVSAQDQGSYTYTQKSLLGVTSTGSATYSGTYSGSDKNYWIAVTISGVGLPVSDPNYKYVWEDSDGNGVSTNTSITSTSAISLQNGISIAFSTATVGGTDFHGGDTWVYYISKISSPVFQVQDATKNYLSLNTSNSFMGFMAGDSATNAIGANFIGSRAGQSATNAFNSNFIGMNAGISATNANASNFIGWDAGYGATNAHSSNFLGYRAGDGATGSSFSNFIGDHAGDGSTNAFNSDFIGEHAGYQSNAANAIFMGSNAGSKAGGNGNTFDIFIGPDAGNSSSGAGQSIFIGYAAGLTCFSHTSSFGGTDADNFVCGTPNSVSESEFMGVASGYHAYKASNSIFLGYHSGFEDTVNNSDTPGYSILIGDNSSTGGNSNSIAIGNSATNTASHQVMLGGSDITSTVLKGATVLNGVSYSWPSGSAPGSNYVLVSNGSGGLAWGNFANGASGVTGVGLIDSQTKSTDGAVVFGSDIILQTAEATKPGLVSTSNQTFAGLKTFNDGIDIAANGYLNFGNTTGDPGYGIRDSGGTMQFKNNSGSWTAFGSGGGGITSINGFTDVAQNFTVGSAGSDFNIPTGSGAGSVTFNIPDAGASARGLVTTGMQTFAGDKTFSGNTLFSSNVTTNTASLIFNGLSTTSGSGDVLCIDAATSLVTKDATATCSPSSIRFKNNVNDLSDGLDMVNALRPVSFVYKNDSTGLVRSGFIAEEVEKVNPRYVAYESDGVTPHGVYYLEMIPVLTKAIQEQQAQIKDLDVKLKGIADLDTADDTTFVQKLIAWLGKETNGITSLFAGKVETHELCVDGQCLNEQDVKDLLQLRNQMNSAIQATSSAPTSSTSASSSSATSTDTSNTTASDTTSTTTTDTTQTPPPDHPIDLGPSDVTKSTSTSTSSDSSATSSSTSVADPTPIPPPAPAPAPTAEVTGGQ